VQVKRAEAGAIQKAFCSWWTAVRAMTNEPFLSENHARLLRQTSCCCPFSLSPSPSSSPQLTARCAASCTPALLPSLRSDCPLQPSGSPPSAARTLQRTPRPLPSAHRASRKHPSEVDRSRASFFANDTATRPLSTRVSSPILPPSSPSSLHPPVEPLRVLCVLHLRPSRPPPQFAQLRRRR